MFTFVTISYNQEDFILEHLESIKYQVENYGQELKVDFILADDGSQDNTVKYAREWLKCNGEIFHTVTLLDSDENQGTVANVFNAIDSIKTKSFKILAADDLYFIYDVITAYSKPGITLGFSWPFAWDNQHYKICLYDDRSFNKLKYFTLGAQFDRVKSFVKFGLSLSGPGTGYSRELFEDKDLKAFLSQFKLLEDRPLWFYLFCVTRKTFNINLIKKPLILHRSSVGVTSNNNPAFSTFKRDDIKYKEVLKENSSGSFYFFLFSYRARLFFYKYILGYFNSDLLSFKSYIVDNEKLAIDHLINVREKSLEFKASVTEKLEHCNKTS